MPTSSQDYDFDERTFVESADPVALGDIAPHKINFGFNVPMSPYVELNNRFNFVSSRTPYLSNTLRESNFVFAPYFLWNLHLRAGVETFKIGVKVDNVTGANYLIPGGESAQGGDDFSNQSDGFHNSALPTAGRSVLVTANVKL